MTYLRRSVLVGSRTIAIEQHFYWCLFKLLVTKKHLIKKQIIFRYADFFANTASHCNLIVNGQTNEKVNSCKYLGIIIDDKLKWNLHIGNIYKKLMKYTSIFYKLRDKLPDQMLRGIYYAFIHSHVLYGVEIYANTKPTYCDVPRLDVIGYC